MCKNDDETMAARIKRLRLQAGLSQGDLAKFLGVSRVAVIKYENGLSRPVRRLDRIASILNTTADYLLTGRTDISEPLPAVLEEVLLPSEINLLCKYRSLDDKGKHVIDATIDALSPNTEPEEGRQSAPILKEAAIC